MTYLDWLAWIDIPDGEARGSYQKLLIALHNIPFRWAVANDVNRAADGQDLRMTFESETGMLCDKSGPCSVLEMLTALSIRCENEIMYDPDMGDRTSCWFWLMIENLGLDRLNDWAFDEDEFMDIMERFLDRKYCKDGYGGPFFIQGFNKDMRKIELWYQLNHYIRCNDLW